MTGPNPNVTVTFLDTAGDTQSVTVAADAIQVGMNYVVYYGDGTGPALLFPHSRILEMSTDSSNVQNWRI